MNSDGNLLNLFEEWLLNNGRSQSTIKTYMHVIQKFGSWLEEEGCDLTRITRNYVQEYMDGLEVEGKSAATIDKIFSTIRVFTQFIDKPAIVRNIKRKAKDKNIYQTVPDFLNEDERSTLLLEVEKDNDSRNSAIVYMLLCTGIRLSELCNLDRANIEISGQKGTVTITAPNGDLKRIIPIAKDALKAVKQYVEMLPEDYQGPLFISKQNNRLSTRSIQYMLEKYNINPHKLRHTFCRDLVKKGLDLEAVAKLAGHNDINITKRYKIKGA